jgi:phytoene dehydrogenase-like protein
VLLGEACGVVRDWAATQRPVYAATLDLGLRALPVPERRLVFGVDDPFYLSTHTPSAALAPEGGEVVHVMRYGVPDHADSLRAELEAFVDDAQPGWRDELLAVRFNRRLVVAHGRPDPTTGNAGRPTPTIADTPNVFVAGDWVGPDGMLGDASLASGRAAGGLAAASAAATA